MDYNAKRTSKGIASIAARTLQDSNASNIQRQLAGGALSQRSPKKQTGSRLEDTASRVLSSHKYNGLTKTLAGSVLAQSNKKRKSSYERGWHSLSLFICFLLLV